MCGHYYVDDETAKEIEKLVRQAEEKLHRNTADALKRISSADIHPSDEAPVLLAADGRLACTWLHWGFPMQQNQGLHQQICTCCQLTHMLVQSGCDIKVKKLKHKTDKAIPSYHRKYYASHF